MSGSFRSTRFSRGNQVDGSPRILIELPHISVRLKEKKRKKGKERKGKERKGPTSKFGFALGDSRERGAPQSPFAI
jgi:hypothetical protein